MCRPGPATCCWGWQERRRDPTGEKTCWRGRGPGADGPGAQYDIKNRRTFLKRCQYEGIFQDMLYIGSTITVYSRQLKLVGYADKYTAELLEVKAEKTVAVVKPDGVAHLGKIVNAAIRSGFNVAQLKMITAGADFRYPLGAAAPFSAASGHMVAMELVSSDAINKWAELLGPEDPAVAKAEAPMSIRAKFGTDALRNVAWGASTPQEASEAAAFFFKGPMKGAMSAGQKGPSTLCIIKPHAVVAGYSGLVIDQVMEHFEVAAKEMSTLDRVNASEFFEVYKGVVPEYNFMVDELTSSPFIAMEVLGEVDGLRELCGPADPEIARVLRGGSLRAQFGVDKVKNAVHCTDLEDDGPLEVDFFFSLMNAA